MSGKDTARNLATQIKVSFISLTESQFRLVYLLKGNIYFYREDVCSVNFKWTAVLCVCVV